MGAFLFYCGCCIDVCVRALIRVLSGRTVVTTREFAAYTQTELGPCVFTGFLCSFLGVRCRAFDGGAIARTFVCCVFNGYLKARWNLQPTVRFSVLS